MTDEPTRNTPWKVQVNGLRTRVFVVRNGIELEVEAVRLSFGERCEVANQLALDLTALEEWKALAELLLRAAKPCTPYKNIGTQYCQHGYRPAACLVAKAHRDYEALNRQVSEGGEG